MALSHSPVILIGLLLITGFFIPGCTEKNPHDDPVPAESSPPVQPEDGLVSGNGTITFIDLEGGFYGIRSDDGQSLLPDTLPDEYKKDGLSVRYTIRHDPGRMSVMMWGTPVTLISIEQH